MKKELDHEDGHLHLDETTKLLQDLHEAQAERGGSRPSSNLSSLSNTSDRDQHHLGEAAPLGPWHCRSHTRQGRGRERDCQGGCRPPARAREAAALRSRVGVGFS